MDMENPKSTAAIANECYQLICVNRPQWM